MNDNLPELQRRAAAVNTKIHERIEHLRHLIWLCDQLLDRPYMFFIHWWVRIERNKAEGQILAWRMASNDLRDIRDTLRNTAKGCEQ